MKIKNYVCLAFLIIGFTTMESSAQSLYNGNDGKVIAQMLSSNSINVTSSVFQMSGKYLCEVQSGELRQDMPVGSFAIKKDGTILLFNRDDEYSGYYVPKEGRLYAVSFGGKEAPVAVFLDGKIYTSDNVPQYTYDAGFKPEFIGMVLLFFLGYNI